MRTRTNQSVLSLRVSVSDLVRQSLNMCKDYCIYVCDFAEVPSHQSMAIAHVLANWVLVVLTLKDGRPEITFQSRYVHYNS